jgi:glycosyltransferase 2 family protein
MSGGPAQEAGDRLAANPKPRSRVFVSSPDQPRARRAGDAVLVIAGAILLAVGALLAAVSGGLQDEFGDVVSALPDWVDELFSIGYGVAALFGVWLLVLAVLDRRRDIAGLIVLAVLFAIVVGLALAWLVGDTWPLVLPELGRANAAPRFPVIRVAAVAAVVVAVGPHLARPLRLLGWGALGIVFLSGIGLGLGVPTDAVGAVGLGMFAGGAMLLVLGSPAAYPRTEDVAGELIDLSLNLSDLAPTTIQPWGARTLAGHDAAGRPLLVKVYGPDARDAQVFARLWRFLWYRDTGPSVPWSRLQQVEHEALVTLLASAAGVSAPEVISAVLASNDDAIIVTEHRGEAFAEVDAARLTDDVLVSTWREVYKLQSAGISHGALNVANLRLDGTRPVLTNFGAGSMSATSAQTATDVAELIVSLAGMVGVDRAVSTAMDGLGNDALAASVPYIQLPAVSPPTRRSLDQPRSLVKSVHESAVETLGIEEPEPVKVRRVSWQSLVLTALIALAAYFIIQQLAGIDLADVWQSIKTAEWGWVAAAFVVAQLILIPNATGLMAVVAAPIPLRPTIILQSAIQFIGFAVPSTAARVATNVAYLTKFGLTPVAAVTQGALDSFSGFLVQVTILLVAFLFGDADFGVQGDFDANWTAILVVAVALAATGVFVVFRVESLRTRVMTGWGQMRGALSVLAAEPRRVIFLVSSNFGSQLVLGSTMWLSVRAFGTEISLGTALVVVVSAVLLGGLAPTPGGVGVQEAVLSAGLVAAGVSSNTAMAAAIIYRTVTFYLPPIWGAASLRWLRKNEYL